MGDVRASDWWRSAVIYQVYPRSFADADGDGVGDLKGITRRIPYLQALGVDAIWLSPFYDSPMRDGGYDVRNHRAVAAEYGDLEAFDELVRRAHRLGLRVIIDLVPNHTSDLHPWFIEALAAAPDSAERDRYIFRHGQGKGGTEPPNDWRSVFGGPAWTRIPEKGGGFGHWYLHLFDRTQPDLNWSNSDVRREFIDTLRFWLKRGVDGFRVDVAHGLVKDPSLPPWPHPHHFLGDTPPGVPPMWDQDAVHDIYRCWRQVVAEYSKTSERILVAEAWVDSMDRLSRYVRPDEMHQAFNFDFLMTPWDATALRSCVQRSLAANDRVGAPTSWVLSNHDVVRHASRFGLDPPGSHPPGGLGPGSAEPDEDVGLRRARAAAMLMLALPGVTYLYQGEELGLPEDTTLPPDARRDPAFHRDPHGTVGRDGCRVPMPWEAAKPAFGFSETGKSWLPQPASFARYAADTQARDGDSTLELYRRALTVRRAFRLGEGSLSWGSLTDRSVITFRRSTPIGEVSVVTNLGMDKVELPQGRLLLSSAAAKGSHLPPDATAWLSP